MSACIYTDTTFAAVTAHNIVAWSVPSLKSAFVHVEQLSVRTQSQYKQEWLGDLFTADTLYGVGEMRDDAALAFVVPA